MKSFKDKKDLEDFLSLYKGLKLRLEQINNELIIKMRSAEDESKIKEIIEMEKEREHLWARTHEVLIVILSIKDYKDTVMRVYYYGIPIKQIARDDEVRERAVKDRLNNILKRYIKEG